VFFNEYYKKLFGAPDKNNFSMMEDRVQDIPQLSTVENGLLIADFSVEEVYEAISKMEHNKAPGPYGFPVEFY
jgi:hypothetical protein